MKNRLARLLKVLEWYPRSCAPDIDSIALQLGTTPATVRRDLRDLREAGAFDGENRPKLAISATAESAPSADATAAVVTSARVSSEDAASSESPRQATLPAFTLGEGGPANDAPAKRSSKGKPDVRRDDELVAMYVGARFLASEGDAALSEQALLIAHAVEKEASAELVDKLAELDTRYRFGPREAERKVRRAVAQAIAERRALEIRYKGERDTAYRARVVEPTAQFFIHDRWSFYAYDREADEVRQFRHERCKDVTVTDQPFGTRHDRSLDGFVAQRRRAGR
jgi:predicted DNA-binding transcriptional regulator YafY